MMADLQFLTKVATRQQRAREHADKPNPRVLVARRGNKANYCHAKSPKPREFALPIQCSDALTEDQNRNDAGGHVREDSREPIQQIVDAWRSAEDSASKRETQEECGRDRQTRPRANHRKAHSSKENNHTNRQRDRIRRQYANASI